MTKLNKNMNKLDTVFAWNEVNTGNLCMLQKIKKVGMTAKNNSNGKNSVLKNKLNQIVVEQAEQGGIYLCLQ